MAETREVATQAAPAAAQEIERIAKTGGNSWLAVTHYGALSALASAMVRAGIAPKDMGPEKALGVMAFGVELGLGPIAALNSIAFINGKPSMYGDGIMALLMRSGELADMPEESTEGEGDARTATCTLRRKGMATPITRKFSVLDAKRADLWGKTGPWKTYPDRMLRWRAFGWAARDGFADVLRGLWTREEAEDIPTTTCEVRTVDVAPVPVPTAALPPGVVHRAADTAPAPTPALAPSANGLTPHQQELKDKLAYLAHGINPQFYGLLAKYSEFQGDKGPVCAKSIESMRSDKWVCSTLRKVDPDYQVAIRKAEDAAREREAAESTDTSAPETPFDAAAKSDGLPF